MSVIILHDEGEDRAVLYCNTSETPLPWGFSGGGTCATAHEQAEDFEAWFTHKHGRDVRYWRAVYNVPERAYDAWHAAAFVNDSYVGFRLGGELRHVDV